ncbi:MAG: hypothetical protein LC104_18805 [Bacteroidales bacterium]|nr:hypothetical protein [Bacteroidales bacterium]
MTGIEAFLELLATAGVTRIFGNPGTTELPLNDALLADSRFRYILGLHEIAVMGLADGYAMASGGVGVVNLHTATGLGNAMGMLYNAHAEGTPLIVTAGQQDRRLRFNDPVLAADLVGPVTPWTKWAYEVTRIEDLPNAVRRAVQIARTPPTGPVFLSLPVDLQMEACSGLDLRHPLLPDRGPRPATAALEQVATVLAHARNPAIFAGSRVLEAGATAELAAVAECLGAPVFAEAVSSHGRLPMASDHPLYRGPVPPWSPQIQDCLSEFDTLFIVGANEMRLYIHHPPETPIPPGMTLVHLDSDPREVGKNYPLAAGAVGDIHAGLADLLKMLNDRLTAMFQAEAEVRRTRWAATRQKEQTALRQRITAETGARPMTAAALMGALAAAMPEGTAVVEEAPTTHQSILERLGVFRDPRLHFSHRGWGLGWGVGVALGVKLAWPERPVLGLIGDGAMGFGVQGLWSAAHHDIPVTFVVAHNAQYKILKQCAAVMPLPRMSQGEYLAMDLTDPVVDFVSLARGFGVEAERLREPDAVESRVRESLLQSDRPRLFEVAIAPQ